MSGQEAEIWDIHPLSASPEIMLAAPLDPLPPDIAARVDTVWAAEKAVRGERLFDGPLHGLHAFELTGTEPGRIVLMPFRYRHLLARKAHPDLFDGIAPLLPLGVTGVVRCRDGIVFGRRSDLVAFEPGRWEPAPSGGLDRPDPLAVLLEELEEELGLSRSLVLGVEPLCLSIAGDRRVADLVWLMTVDASGPEMITSHAARGTDEYSRVAVVPPVEMAGFLEREAAYLRPLLEHPGIAGRLAAE